MRVKRREERFNNAEALAEGVMATAQDNNISACRRATAFFRQRAVGGYERFPVAGSVHGGGQRDQPSWLQSAEGRIDVLTTQVFDLALAGCAQSR